MYRVRFLLSRRVVLSLPPWILRASPTSCSALLILSLTVIDRTTITQPPLGACSWTLQDLPSYPTYLSFHAAGRTPGRLMQYCNSPLHQWQSSLSRDKIDPSSWGSRCYIPFAFAAAWDFADSITSNVSSPVRMYASLSRRIANSCYQTYTD